MQAVPGFEFQILDADPRRIKRVRIMRKRALTRRRPKGEADLLLADQTAPAVLPPPSTREAERPHQ